MPLKIPIPLSKNSTLICVKWLFKNSEDDKNTMNSHVHKRTSVIDETFIWSWLEEEHLVIFSAPKLPRTFAAKMSQGPNFATCYLHSRDDDRVLVTMILLENKAQ